MLKVSIVKDILKKLLVKHKIEVADNNWPVLLNFAERKGMIDVKFLLDTFK